MKKIKWENVWENVGAVVWILTPILAVVAFIWMTSSMISDFNEITDKKESYVGTKVLIGKDSLSVVNYSLFGDTYTLENGVKVDKSLVEKEE